MELTMGWSTEYAHQKFSITVDETDFLQLMAEQGIGALAGKVSFYSKFRLLETTARYLSEAESLRVISEEKLRAQAQERADKALAERLLCLKNIRVSLGQEYPGEQQPVPGD